MNSRRLPWWVPRTRAMRSVCVTAAVLLAGVAGLLAKVLVHSFWAAGSPGVVLGMGVLGVVIGFLLVLALGPLDRS